MAKFRIALFASLLALVLLPFGGSDARSFAGAHQKPNTLAAPPFQWQHRGQLPAPSVPYDPAAPVFDYAVMASSAPAGPADLDPTVDVQITSEITDLANELGSPLAMYEFVRNQCRFQPYYGSQKGSVETLHQRSGNDYDLASLLIALLRASGTPARYASGTVEIPAAQAASWLEVEDASVAGGILYTHGLDGTSLTSGSDVVAVRCHRVWVEAGVQVGYGGPTWIMLDPAFKTHQLETGIDIPADMAFDSDAFVAEYYDPSDPGVTLPRAETVVELFEQDVDAFLATTYPQLGLEDVAVRAQIQPESLELLPSVLPYTLRARDGSFSEIGASERYQLRFHLYDGGTTLLDHTVDLPTIASQRVTLSYEGATPSDQAIIDAAGGLLYTSPDLISIRPLLKVGGQTVATGNGIGAGRTHSSDLHFLAPTNGSGLPVNVVPQIQNTMIAGETQAIGLAVHGVYNPLFNAPDPSDTEGFLAQLRYVTALGYLERGIVADDRLGSLFHARVTSSVADAIVQDQLFVTYDFGGNPIAWDWRGLTVDADRKIVGAWSLDHLDAGCEGDARDILLVGGADGSLNESLIYEQEFGHEAVSTIKILELCADQGIPIYTDWDSTTLPAGMTLSTAVQNAIISAIASGHVVTFPRDPLTYFNWSGTGYIDKDPCSGAAGYIISGGQNGGSTVDSWTDIVPLDPMKTLDHIEGDVTVPASDAPDNAAVFSIDDPNKLHFEYRLRAVYTDGTSDAWADHCHDSVAPSTLSSGEYTLTVGDQGADHQRALVLFKLELQSATFGGTGNHALKTDNGTFASNGTGDVRVPQIKKGEAATEILYTWESQPTINAEFAIKPDIQSASKALKLKIDAKQLGETANLVYDKDVTATGSSLSVAFTVTNGGKLAKKIFNNGFDCDWKVSGDGGSSYKTLQKTTNPLLVIAGTPTASVATLKRMNAVTNAAAGMSTEATIVAKLWSDLAGPGSYSLGSPYPNPEWKILDGTPGECIAIAHLFEKCIKITGLAAGDGRVVYLYADPAGTSHENTSTSDFAKRDCRVGHNGHTASVGSTHAGSHMWEKLTFRDGGGGWNNWEACYKYRHKASDPYIWYAAGTGGMSYTSVQNCMNAITTRTRWRYTTPSWGSLGTCTTPGPYPEHVW